MRRECRERFPRHRFQRKPFVSDPGMHHGTCVTRCMSGSLTRGGLGKRSQHSRRMRNPQFYVSGKSPIHTIFLKRYASSLVSYSWRIWAQFYAYVFKTHFANQPRKAYKCQSHRMLPRYLKLLQICCSNFISFYHCIMVLQEIIIVGSGLHSVYSMCCIEYRWCFTGTWLYMYDDVINWKYLPRHWPFVRGIHRSPGIPLTETSDAELWCFLWSAPDQTAEQIIETPVKNLDTIAFIMTSL